MVMPSQKGPLQPSKAPSIPPMSSPALAPAPATVEPSGFSLFLHRTWFFPVKGLLRLLSCPLFLSVCLVDSCRFFSSHIIPPLPLISKWAATELPLGLCGSATYFDTHAGKTPFHTIEKQLNLFSNVRQYSPWISAISNIC